MTDPVDEGIGRAKQELRAAALLSENGFAAPSISRAYYAAFYAAEAALLHVGETRAKHSGVVSAFSQILVRERGLEERARRLLRSLFERRSHADYTLDPVLRSPRGQSPRRESLSRRLNDGSQQTGERSG